jgi:hypothetical protein
MDYIPSREGDKMNWLLNNATFAAANAVTLGVPTARATLYLTAVTAAQAAVTAAVAAADAARAALINKQEKIGAAVALAREVAGMVQANPAVTNVQRETGGWPIHDTTRTPQAPPTAVPAIVLKPGTQWQQPIGIVDLADPTRRGRPDGVDAWQVFLCVGNAAPIGINNCRLVGQTTRPDFTVPFEPTDAGKTAWILARAVNNKGETGPLGTPVPVTIAASLAA